MSSKIGSGVPPPAKLENIIEDLFQNEKWTTTSGNKIRLSFSKVQLTADQIESLIYRPGFTSIDLYLYYQTDEFDVNDDLISTIQQLISFTKRENKFIYGHYFNITNQERFPIERLLKSKNSIDLSPNSTFISDNYIEVYNDIDGITVILGLDTFEGQIAASLQYSRKSKYFYENLTIDGIQDPLLPITKVIGLSKNLEDID